MQLEMSGYLGDLILGDTWYGSRTALDVLIALAYWASPVSLDVESALDRVAAALCPDYAPAWVLLDEKRRRATNGWPHLAVNDLEVRKPSMDCRFVEFCTGLPPSDRIGHALYLQLLATRDPAYGRVPYQKIGVSPLAVKWRHRALQGYRLGYRTVRRLTGVVGIPMKPWIRGATDGERWFHDPAVRSELTSTLTEPNAWATLYFDRGDVAEMLHKALDARKGPVEVSLNLYRVEKYLTYLRNLNSGGRPGRNRERVAAEKPR